MKETIKNILVGLFIFGLIVLPLGVVIIAIEHGLNLYLLVSLLIPMFYILGKEIRGK